MTNLPLTVEIWNHCSPKSVTRMGSDWVEARLHHPFGSLRLRVDVDGGWTLHVTQSHPRSAAEISGTLNDGVLQVTRRPDPPSTPAFGFGAGASTNRTWGTTGRHQYALHRVTGIVRVARHHMEVVLRRDRSWTLTLDGGVVCSGNLRETALELPQFMKAAPPRRPSLFDEIIFDPGTVSEVLSTTDHPAYVQMLADMGIDVGGAGPTP